MKAAPALAVIVATRNRADSLARCLASLEALPAEPAIEVCVVDNGSSDDTAAVVAAAAARDARIRGVFEAAAGLSKARNRGARETRAPLLAYLDDDATAAEGWSREVVAAFADAAVAVVGGPIRPRFEVDRPAWFVDEHLGALSCQDLGPEPRSVETFPYLFGANFSLRRSDWEAVGGFDENYGRSGDSLLSGEDTDLCERLLASGRRLHYAPTAAVDHWIPPERLTKDFLRRRAWATGRTRGRQLRQGRSSGAALGVLALKLAKLPAHAALWGLARASGRSDLAATREWSLAASLGTLSEWARWRGR